MDINDGIGLSQFAAQAVIFLGKLEHTAILGLCGIGLASAFLGLQRGALIGSTLPAPSGQVGGVNPFFAQQGANLTRLGTTISGIQDAAFVATGKLSAPGRGNTTSGSGRAPEGAFPAALRASSKAPSGAVNCGDSIVSAFDLFMILIYLYTLISEG